jgi:hypothetical protein
MAGYSSDSESRVVCVRRDLAEAMCSLGINESVKQLSCHSDRLILEMLMTTRSAPTKASEPPIPIHPNAPERMKPAQPKRSPISPARQAECFDLLLYRRISLPRNKTPITAAAPTSTTNMGSLIKGSVSWESGKVLTCTTGFAVRPNVRAKLPAEAGFVSPVRDDSTTGADRAYKACRSGSA